MSAIESTPKRKRTAPNNGNPYRPDESPTTLEEIGFFEGRDVQSCYRAIAVLLMKRAAAARAIALRSGRNLLQYILKVVVESNEYDQYCAQDSASPKRRSCSIVQ
jgi:hypothetical protein